LHHALQSSIRFDLRNQFNAFFEETRTKESILHPHPIMRVPVEIFREIFEAAARADPDAPLHLLETCIAWRDFVLETPSIWNNIYIAVDDDDSLKALPASLLFSKTKKLDVTIVGTRAPTLVVDELGQGAHRIRTLEICLHKAAREPFRRLSTAPPDGLCSLSRLAVETHSVAQTGVAGPKTIMALERIKQDQNALEATDLNLLQTLPMLSSLTSLVLHDVGTVDIPPLELLSLKSLRIVLQNSPAPLQNLKCNALQALDVVLEDTSRDGWWDFLRSSLNYLQLIDLSVDATLDREQDDWTNPWTFRSHSRLPTRESVTTLTIALAFSDWKYIWAPKEKAEYLCGDLLDEFIGCFPYLSNLHLLHVPFLHSPFIWPMEQILLVLRKLELNVPGIVYDTLMPVIELPGLCELRYYGYIRPDTTQLPSLRTPCLQYLEIMHSKRSVHPFLGQINRHWPGHLRRHISSEYNTSQNNSVKDFPEDIPVVDRLLYVIHQSFTLQELRLYLGDPFQEDTIRFKLTTFPVLKRLHCSMFYVHRIDAPQLEELYLLLSTNQEIELFEKYAQKTKEQRILNMLKVLDIYSRMNDEFSRPVTIQTMGIDKWIPYLKSLRMVVFPHFWGCLNTFVDALSRDPHICPALTTITCHSYPGSWTSLCHSLEIRNHLSMRDRSVQAIHTLYFRSAVHRNISGPLEDALSGEFASPFVPIPLQPWTLHELRPQVPEGAVQEQALEIACLGCRTSGNTFKCEGGPRHGYCPRHMGQKVAINAYRRDISGYLEWNTTETVN
jgi:Leucine-rich repeat (LRR) protein